MAAAPQPWAGQTYSPPTPLDVATVENAIVAQLRAAVANQIEVAHFPDRPESYRLTHRVGAALVIFKGASYSPDTRDTQAIIQERALTWHLEIIMRDLGWAYGGQPSGPSPGAYQILEAIRAALTGFIVPGYRKMFPVTEEFLSRDKEGGVWYYAADYRHVTLAVEPSTTPELYTLTEIQDFEKGGVTTIPVGAAAFTFNSQGQIALPYQNLSAVSVTSDPAGTNYYLGVDYTVDTVFGIITRLAGGAIAAEATVLVAYSYSEVVTVSD